MKSNIKTIALLMLIVTAFNCSKDDDNQHPLTIAIPDANFEQALISLGHDTNGLTGDILKTEAEAVTFLDVSNKSIASLQGIEGFINITTLHCQINELTSLDVSSNTALVELSCNSNQITSLDLSSNTVLERLYCSNTELTALDVSSNTALTQINCFSNQLQRLNVKNNNNANFTLFNATNNPNLECIIVDDPNYSYANWFNGIEIPMFFVDDISACVS